MKRFGSRIVRFVGQITSKEMIELSFALPFAVATKVTLKIPISDVSKTILWHTTEEFGEEGQPGDVTLELVLVAW